MRINRRKLRKILNEAVARTLNEQDANDPWWVNFSRGSDDDQRKKARQRAADYAKEIDIDKIQPGDLLGISGTSELTPHVNLWIATNILQDLDRKAAKALRKMHDQKLLVGVSQDGKTGVANKRAYIRLRDQIQSAARKQLARSRDEDPNVTAIADADVELDPEFEEFIDALEREPETDPVDDAIAAMANLDYLDIIDDVDVGFSQDDMNTIDSGVESAIASLDSPGEDASATADSGQASRGKPKDGMYHFMDDDGEKDGYVYKLEGDQWYAQLEKDYINLNTQEAEANYKLLNKRFPSAVKKLMDGLKTGKTVHLGGTVTPGEPADEIEVTGSDTNLSESKNVSRWQLLAGI